MKPIVFKNNRGKVCGWMRNETYFKTVDSRKHFMRNFAGYGIDEFIVEKIKDKCKKIRLKETDTGRIYEVDFTKFLNSKLEKDYGYGRQMFLPIKEWVLEDNTVKLF